MALLGNPQDVLTTPYGYAGQMAPETAIAEQALNRRRLLANMLTQQGLQPAQGRMAGRFYVAPSPLQGGAGLAQVLAGTLGNRMIDSQQGDLMKQDRQMVEDAIKNWKERQSQAPVGAAPSQAPPMAPEQAHLPPPQGVEEAGLQVSGKPIPPEMLRNIGPRPQATQGAVPMLPDVRPQEATPAQLGPIQRNPSNAFSGDLALGYPAPNTVPSGTNPSGLSQDVTPGDMSTMVNSADPAKAQAQLGEQPPMPPPAQAAPPAPPQAPAPMQPGPPRKTTMEDLAQLMTHQHPQVRAYGQFLAQQMQKEQEREIAERHRQEDMGLKMLEHNTPSGSAKMMSEAQQATAKEANAARVQEMTLRHNDEQKKLEELARHHGSVEKYNADKQALDAQQARERNAIDLKIAGMKANPSNRPMSSTAQKELIQTEEELQGSHQAIQNLQNALAINKDAMGFTGAGAVASAGSLLPEAIRPKTVDATVDLDNLITGSALPQLKAIFGGMPTEGERKVLLELQGSSSKTPAQRQAIFERAIQAANNRIKFNTQKAQQLRSGQYFAGDGGLDTTVSPNPGMPKPAPPAAPSMKNAQGWVLHTDANGNKAYVSPDGKQFEEVR